MRKRLVPLVVLLISATVLAADNTDEAQIKQLQARQVEAWNHHDAKAYADLFTEDGEVINVVGWWWKGQREIEKKLTAAFAYVFRDSTMTIEETDVRFLTPRIAIAHVRWSMTGSHTPPNIPEPKHGLEIQVLQKRSGQWKIVSFQNTNSVPETPFPPGPPK